MRRGKKLLVTLLALSLTAGILGGCGSNGGNIGGEDEGGAGQASSASKAVQESQEGSAVSKAEENKEIVVAIDSDIGDISPFGVSGGGRNYVRFMLYDCIAQASAPGQSIDEMDWALAKNITKIDDLTYEIEIYDYIYDTAGNHMTASDVAFSLNKAVELGTSSKFSSNFDHCTVTGDYTVELGITTPKLGIIEYMCSQIPVVVQTSYEAQSENERATKPVTTGPYKISELVSGSYLVMEKNEKYWQTDDSMKSYQAAQNVDKVTLQVTTENSQRAIALETKSATVATSVAVSDIGQFINDDGSARDGYNVKSVLSGTTTVLEFNCDEGAVFDNKELRQAVLYAIDSEAVMQAALSGNGMITNDFSSQAASDYDKGWNDEDYYGYDEEKAKEMMKEAGYPDGGLKIKIMTWEDTAMKTACQVVQAYLLQIGISSEIVVYDNALFNTNMYDSKQWDILINGYGCTDYVVDTWSLRFDRTGFSNNKTGQFIADDKLQELLLAACNIETHSMETVDAFHEYVRDNAYACGLYTPYKYVVALDSVEELVTHPWGQVIAGACRYK